MRSLEYNIKSKRVVAGISSLIVLYMLLIPFFRFSGLSNFKVMLAALLVGLLVTNRPLTFSELSKPKLTGFILLFVWCCVCLPLSRSPFFTLEWLLDLICYNLFFLLVANRLKSDIDLNRINVILIGFLAVELLFSLGQMMNISALYYYSETQRGDNAILASEGGRFWGTFRNSLSLASFASAVGIYLYTVYNHRFPLRSYVILAVTVFLIFMSGTRSGMVSFIVVFALNLIQSRGKAVKAILYLSVLISIIYAVGGFDAISNSTLLQRSVEGRDGRLIIWYSAIPLFNENPIAGTTIGNLSTAMAETNVLKNVISINKDSKNGHVENVYFTVLLSTGIIGLGLFLYQYYLTFRKIRAMKAKNPPPYHKTVINAISLALLSISISMIFEPSFFTNQNSVLLLLLLLGILYSVYLNRTEARR